MVTRYWLQPSRSECRAADRRVGDGGGDLGLAVVFRVWLAVRGRLSLSRLSFRFACFLSGFAILKPNAPSIPVVCALVVLILAAIQ